MAPHPEEQRRCERDCSRLCHDFAWTVDHLDYDAFVDLFAPDGVFERAGQRSAGHEAIRAFLIARPTGRVTRHLCGNVRIDMTGPDAATGTCVALVLAGATGDTPPAPSPPLVVDYTDDYVRTADGWKFSHRRTAIVFGP
ncbi:MAG: nuclear transport factor 2 family protein [Rhodoferax sp.]|nr:nuclear transport factor 2 family protein [Rhodoferax sp.]